MKIRSSHLALRFYKSDGWTRPVLESFLVKGILLDTSEVHGDPSDWGYFILDVGSSFDVDRLLTVASDIIDCEGRIVLDKAGYAASLNW